MFGFVGAIGRMLINFTNEVGRVLLLLADTLRYAAKPPYDFRNTLKQMMEVGVMSVPVVLITAIFTGMVLALQTYTGFKRFGAETLVGSVVALSLTREMGPVLTGLIVAGRAGAAIAAELGTMRGTEQIGALSAMGADPVYYLVVPRFLATFLLIPILTAFSDVIGILGGYLVSVDVFGINEHFYWYHTARIMETWDVMEGIIKTFFFGGFIAFISCYQGFHCEPGAEGVGRACTKAFVVSFMAILVVNFFLAVFFKTLYEFLWPM